MMELTSDVGASRRSQVLRNPLKTLVPVNASRNRVVDKQMDLLVFSWRRQQHGRTLLPPMTHHHSHHATKPSNGPPSQESLPRLNVGSNSLTPFYTVVKPTCGYRFSWETDHKRRHIGIPASNPVMWRSC